MNMAALLFFDLSLSPLFPPHNGKMAQSLRAGFSGRCNAMELLTDPQLEWLFVFLIITLDDMQTKVFIYFGCYIMRLFLLLLCVMYILFSVFIMKTQRRNRNQRQILRHKLLIIFISQLCVKRCRNKLHSLKSLLSMCLINNKIKNIFQQKKTQESIPSRKES